MRVSCGWMEWPRWLTDSLLTCGHRRRGLDRLYQRSSPDGTSDSRGSSATGAEALLQLVKRPVWCSRLLCGDAERERSKPSLSSAPKKNSARNSIEVERDTRNVALDPCVASRRKLECLARAHSTLASGRITHTEAAGNDIANVILGWAACLRSRMSRPTPAWLVRP